jgi:hypothetical protein
MVMVDRSFTRIFQNQRINRRIPATKLSRDTRMRKYGGLIFLR